MNIETAVYNPHVCVCVGVCARLQGWSKYASTALGRTDITT